MEISDIGVAEKKEECVKPDSDAQWPTTNYVTVNEAQVLMSYDLPVAEEVEVRRECLCANYTTVPGINIDEIYDLNIPSDDLHHIDNEDIDLASQLGLIRTNNRSKTPIKADRKAMRSLLRHIYDVSGEVYDDIPTKYRSSHLSLAIYLKMRLRSNGKNTTANHMA